MRQPIALLCVVSLVAGGRATFGQSPGPEPRLGLSDLRQLYAERSQPGYIVSADVNALTRGVAFPNPLEQIAVEDLLYGDHSRRNAGTVVAFVETFYNSDRFATPADATAFFEAARARYESIGDPKELGQILQGALKTGLSLSPTNPAGSAISGTIDLFGSVRDLKQRSDADDLRRKTAVVGANASKLQFDIQLHPERASPILKKLFTGSSNASQEEFAKALANLPASKGDVAFTAERLEGTIGETVALMSKRIDRLTKQLATEGGNSKQMTSLAAEIRSSTELMGKLVENTALIETSFSRILKLEQDRATAAARAQEVDNFKAAMANTVSIIKSAGQLLNLPADDVEKSAALLNGSSQLILGLTAAASPDPLATAAAGLNLVNLLFGSQSSGVDPHRLILQAIESLRRDMDRQFDRVNLKLDQIDQDIRLLADYMGKRFDRIDATLRQLAEQSSDNQSKLINHFRDVEDLINSNYKISRAVNWADMISDLEAYREAFTGIAGVDSEQKITELSLSNLRRDDFRRSMRRLLTAMSLDDTGFGYPGIAGSKNCFDDALQQIKKASDGPVELERKSHEVIEALQNPTYSVKGSPQAYCVARFVQDTLSHVPVLEVKEDASLLELLPGDILDGHFVTWKDSNVFTPKHVWEFSHRIGSTLAYIPNAEARYQVTQDLLQRMRPTLQILQLTNTEAGYKLLSIAYSELAAEIVADISRTFYNPFMQATLDYQQWKSGLLREVGGPEALNATKVLYDSWTDQVARVKPFRLPESVAKKTALDTNQIFEVQRAFFKSLATFRLVEYNKIRLDKGGWQPAEPFAQDEFKRHLSDYLTSLNKIPAAFDAGLDLFLKSYPVLGLSGGLDESLDRFIENVWCMKIIGLLIDQTGDLASGSSAGLQGNGPHSQAPTSLIMESFFEAIQPFVAAAVDTRSGKAYFTEQIIKRAEMKPVDGKTSLNLYYVAAGAVTVDRDLSTVMHGQGVHELGCSQGPQFWTNGRKNCFTAEIQVGADLPQILRRNFLLRGDGGNPSGITTLSVPNFKIEEQTPPAANVLASSSFILLPPEGDGDRRPGPSGPDMYAGIFNVFSPGHSEPQEVGAKAERSTCNALEFKVTQPYRTLRMSEGTPKASFNPSIACSVTVEVIKGMRIANSTKNSAADLLASEYRSLSFEAASLSTALGRHGADGGSEGFQSMIIDQIKSWFAEDKK